MTPAFTPVFNELSKKLGELGAAQPLSMRRNLEQRYATEYQRMVRSGLAPQIRGKYRGQA
jgi:hypothetical protein